jgi:integrase
MRRGTHNLRLRGQTYHYRFENKGQEFEGSLETGDLSQAKERRDRKLAELKAANWGETPKRTFNQAAERFGEEHFPNLKPATRTRYTVSIANLLEDLNGVKLDAIDAVKLGEFERRRKAMKVTSATIRRDLACLSVIFTLAEGWVWVKGNPVKPYIFLRNQTKALPNSKPRERYLDHDEEEEIILYAPKKSKRAVIFGIDTGLRKAEQFGVEWRDMDFKKRRIRVRKELVKTAKERYVPMLPRVYGILKEMHAARDQKCPYVFATQDGARYSAASPYYYQALQTAVMRANKAREKAKRQPMEHVEWHDLRRTCGCRLLQDRKFLMEEVSKWLGHTSIKVTEQHYAFLHIDQLDEAVERSETRVIELRQRRQATRGDDGHHGAANEGGILERHHQRWPLRGHPLGGARQCLRLQGRWVREDRLLGPPRRAHEPISGVSAVRDPTDLEPAWNKEDRERDPGRAGQVPHQARLVPRGRHRLARRGGLEGRHPRRGARGVPQRKGFEA